MRTQGILLVREATFVLNSRSTDRKADLDILFWAATNLRRIQMLRRRMVDKNHDAGWLSPWITSPTT